MKYLSTGAVADLLGVPTHKLDYLTRDRQIRPTKGPTGVFFWTYLEVSGAARLMGVPAPSEEDFLSAVAGGMAR